MKKTVLAILFLALFGISIKSQEYFGSYMIVGSSFTYMKNTVEDSYFEEFGYKELTWNINAGIKMSKRIFTGLHLLNIYSSEVHTKKDYYTQYVIGVNYRFNRQ